MNKFFLVLLNIALLYVSAHSQITGFEKSKGKKTATYFESIAWYEALDSGSSKLTLKEIGPTDAVYPLHLVMISNEGVFDPREWREKNKIVIFVNNGIHPGEPDGIDASMMLARDICKGKIIFPDNIVLALIPVYNIGGSLNRNSTTRVNQNGPDEYGFRGNAQNLDLNRDFTKCDSREARSFAKAFHFLDPDIFIDNHVSDGADYQHTMTLITTQYDKLGPTLGAWLKESFEPAIYKTMGEKGWDMIPYIDFGTNDISKGFTMFNETPRYSSGFASLFNCLAFIPETHMLKPYTLRVKSTYDLMVTFIQQASLNANSLTTQRKKAKESALIQQDFPLSWKPDTSKFSEITFKGFEVGYKRSEATGLQGKYYDHSRPFTKNIKLFNVYQPINVIKKPAAYIIPQGWYAVVDLLKINGVTVKQFSSDTLISVRVYHIDDYKAFSRAFEKHHKNYEVKVSSSVKQLKIFKGDFMVELNQAANRYIIEMLEPTGGDSFFAWNFFDAILQQKEGYSDYRWEEIAAGVLVKDTALNQKLNLKKATDEKFARNGPAILDYIYKNSAWYEAAHMRYPVYRLE